MRRAHPNRRAFASPAAIMVPSPAISRSHVALLRLVDRLSVDPPSGLRTQHRFHVASARRPGRPADAAEGWQRRRCGDCRGGGDDGARAVQQWVGLGLRSASCGTARSCTGLNASGTAPAAWTPDYFRRKYGADAKTPPVRGWDSATVPGAVASWVSLSERFGKLPFADLLEPAVEIAERGYAVPIVIQQKWVAATPLLREQPGFAEAFLPTGRFPNVGERFAFPAAARAFIARHRRDARRGVLSGRDRASHRGAFEGPWRDR